MKKLMILAIVYTLSTTSAYAQYMDAQPGGNVPYTAEETTARQADEKAWADGKDLRESIQDYQDLKSRLADQLPEATAAIAAGVIPSDDFTETANELASVKSVIQAIGGDDAVAGLNAQARDARIKAKGVP